MWIAFRIVFLLMIPNINRKLAYDEIVVNCFQNCIFTYDSQPNDFLVVDPISCELLSELYFYLWFPTITIVTTAVKMLWIAFRIVFLLMIPNPSVFIAVCTLLWIAFRIVFLLMIPNTAKQILLKVKVVNCFQNCIFTYDSQLISPEPSKVKGCELLSELYFYLWFPT